MSTAGRGVFVASALLIGVGAVATLLPHRRHVETVGAGERERTAAAAPSGSDPYAALYRPNLCGPVSLALIFRLHDIPVTVDEVAAACEVTGSGITVAELVRVAETRGLRAEPVWADLETLKRVRRPAVIDSPRGHYCVFAGWRGDRALIVDPPRQPELWPVDVLTARWGGLLVTFTPTAGGQ